MIQISPLPTVWGRRDEPNFFHPSIAALADGTWLMTMQRQTPYDDIYGAPEYAVSSDGGKHWMTPEPLASMAYWEAAPEIIRNVADIRVFSAPDRREALVIGVTSYYRHGARLPLAEHTAATPKCPMYAFYTPAKGWSGARLLEAECFAGPVPWRAACTEPVWRTDDDIILPVYFNETGNRCAVRTLRLERRSGQLRTVAWGPALSHEVERGFLEPSAVFFRGRYFLTIRAEDGHAYWSESADGLNWAPPAVWRFDDGAALETGSTQQHWLLLGDHLCLVYTRHLPENSHVMRWRSPLLIAEFVPGRGTLRRATECPVFPYREREGLYNRMGNFHAAAMPDGSGLISVGAAYCRVENSRILEHFSEVCIAKATWEQI